MKNLLKGASWAVQRSKPPQKRRSMGTAAAKGIGAVVAAIPIGMWIGRKFGRKGTDDLRR